MKSVTRRVQLKGWLALVAAFLVCAGSIDPASAMNMAFRHRKQIFALGSGAIGQNYTSLPDASPYFSNTGGNKLCDHLNLSNQGTITQIDAQAGLVNAFQCGQLQVVPFAPTVGVVITDSATTDGLIIGSDIPGNSFTFYTLGGGAIGRNVYPVEYHRTAVTPEDICSQCGLSSGAQVTRFDAAAGNVQSHVCGQLPLFNLVDGEAVLILEPNGPVTCTPPHF